MGDQTRSLIWHPTQTWSVRLAPFLGHGGAKIWLTPAGLEPRDMSHFDVLSGNLPNLIIHLALVWTTAGFLEELLWRGYLINRLVDLLGSQTNLAWAIVVVVSAVIFGLGHGYQGSMGMLKTGAVGLVLGLSYLVVGRNLWPLISSHASIDCIGFVTHYFGA